MPDLLPPVKLETQESFGTPAVQQEIDVSKLNDGMESSFQSKDIFYPGRPSDHDITTV